MIPLVDALRDVLGTGPVVTDTDVLSGYVHDEAQWAPHGTPTALVRARSTADVRAVVSLCAEYGAPVVPRGAGTGISGGANAVDGCVILSLETMREILEVDPRERLAVVQPGVVNDDLRRACAEVGMWYPPDPASSPWSTIGGNVATNAGGVCCVKYGVTRDYVLAVEAVVGRGEVVRLGRRTAKGVVGYDLCGLMVGSEGTLGVITEITVRLRGARPPERTVVGFFASLAAAGEAVRAITAAGIVPSALELVDRHCLAAVDRWKNMGLAGRRRGAAARPERHAGRGGGRRHGGVLRERRRDLERPLGRRGRGRRALRRAAAGLSGPRAARKRPHRGRVRSPRPRCRDARADRAERPASTTY